VKSNAQYWSDKVAGNRARDERHRASLVREGWTVIAIWECEINKAGGLQKLLDQIKERDSRTSKL
jgi:DNA mismatch endonuclease (patch repair protein)